MDSRMDSIGQFTEFQHGLETPINSNPGSPKPSSLKSALHSIQQSIPAIPDPHNNNSGTSTPSSELAAKSRKYFLTADDSEIRSILQARLNREEAKAGGKKSVRLRDLVFTKRFSKFDRQNPLSAESPFHGFFTLFWLGICIMLIRIAAMNWRTYGSILGNAEILHIMFDRDIIVLGLTDGVMFGSTIFGLVLQKLVQWRFISWRKTGWLIQSVWQIVYLTTIIAWTFYREWPWTHTIFIVLHTLVFLMKQHSYAFTNGYFSQLARRQRLLEDKLDHLRSMDQLLNESQLAKGVSSALEASSIQRSDNKSDKVMKRPPLGSRAPTDPKTEDPKSSLISAVLAAMDRGAELTSLEIDLFASAITSEIKAIRAELNTTVPDDISKQYPNNLTIYNWLDFSLLPTLVYELNYPRQKKINWFYVAEKSAATLGVIWVMIIVSQAYIYPLVSSTVAMKEAHIPLSTRLQEFPWVVSDLLFPLILEYLLVWYLIWECLLNVLAETTRFADRNFYGEWWNSYSWSDYAREWNVPVHDFLLRHVYNSSISSFHLSKTTATFITFFLSAIVHELLMFVLFKKVRGYLFLAQLLQIPLSNFSRTNFMKGQKTLGNLLFWCGLFIGPSVLVALYLIV